MATLLAAVCGGETAKVRELLQVPGANANARGPYGATALHWAATEDACEVIGVLVEFGADLEARTQDGCTPLHFACREDNPGAVRALLALGASAAAANDKGETPEDTIWDREQMAEVLDLLAERGDVVGGEVTRAVELGGPEPREGAAVVSLDAGGALSDEAYRAIKEASRKT